MDISIQFQPGRIAYMKWVERAVLGRWPQFDTFAEVGASALAFDLRDALADAWPAADRDDDLTAGRHARDQALVWLTGVSAFARRQSIYLSTDGRAPSMLEAWAKLAPNRRESKRLDINESRFLRWLKSSDWGMFYDETLTGLRVVRGAKIDAGSLYDIARMRADSLDQHSDAFNRGAAFVFYGAQQHA
ncbi:hypothetical protein ACQUKI_20800 [Ralstonia pseudosolanacearum]